MTGSWSNGHAPLIISGFSSQELAEDIAQCLGTRSISLQRQQFADREIRLTLDESVSDRKVIVVASAAGDPNKNLFETVLLLSAVNSARAAQTTLLHPGIAYARADGTWGTRGFPGLEASINVLRPHCHNAIVLDPHNPDLTASLFRSGSTHRVCITPHIAFPAALQLNSLIRQGLINPQIWKPTHADVGSSKRIGPDFKKCMASITGLAGLDNFAQAFKDRNAKTNEVTITSFSQNVEGMDVVVWEDMIDRGGTIVKLSKLLKEEKGARSVTVFGTHGIFSSDESNGESLTAAVDRINQSGADAVFVSDSYNHALTDPEREDAIHQSPIIHRISIAPLLALYVHALHAGYNPEHPDDNSVSAVLEGCHHKMVEPHQIIARPVALKPGNPLLRLKAA